MDAKRLPIRNWGPRLVALFIAAILWLHVVTEDVYEDTVRVSLSMEDMPDGLIVSNEVPKTALVKISGPGKLLLRAGYDLLKVVVRPNHAIGVVKRYYLSVENLEGPLDPGLKPETLLEPEFVEIKLDRRAVKKLPVAAQVEMRVKDGYTQVGPLSLTPDQVEVSGPWEFVRPLSLVFTDSVKLSEMDAPVRRTVLLRRSGEEHVVLDPDRVLLAIDVQELAERWIEGVRVSVKNAPYGRKVAPEPSKLAVKVKGGEKVLASLKTEDFAFTVDYRRWVGSGHREIPAEIVRPGSGDILLIDMKPKSFNIIRKR